MRRRGRVGQLQPMVASVKFLGKRDKIRVLVFLHMRLFAAVQSSTYCAVYCTVQEGEKNGAEWVPMLPSCLAQKYCSHLLHHRHVRPPRFFAVVSTRPPRALLPLKPALARSLGPKGSDGLRRASRGVGLIGHLQPAAWMLHATTTTVACSRATTHFARRLMWAGLPPPPRVLRTDRPTALTHQNAAS